LNILEGGHQNMTQIIEHRTESESIPGYDYGRPQSAKSPLTIEELWQIEATVGWSKQDVDILRRHGDVFRHRAEQMVDSWRAVIGKQPHLAKWFFRPDGSPDDEYKAKVKRRFVQWILDVCFRDHDQDWLDYQEEISLRHTPAKKNLVDAAQTPTLVPLRYLIAFGAIVMTSARKFFVEEGLRDVELQMLEDAWSKAVQLHITLWSRPYARDGMW
jgi:hypothetical protein